MRWESSEEELAAPRLREMSDAPAIEEEVIDARELRKRLWEENDLYDHQINHLGFDEHLLLVLRGRLEEASAVVANCTSAVDELIGNLDATK